MDKNPSLFYDPVEWQKRTSIQDRLTIYAERPRHVVCTIVHPDRVSAADLKLITAAPTMAAALQLADRAIIALLRKTQDTDDLTYEALKAVKVALYQAGLMPTIEPEPFTGDPFTA